MSAEADQGYGEYQDIIIIHHRAMKYAQTVKKLSKEAAEDFAGWLVLKVHEGMKLESASYMSSRFTDYVREMVGRSDVNGREFTKKNPLDPDLMTVTQKEFTGYNMKSLDLPANGKNSSNKLVDLIPDDEEKYCKRQELIESFFEILDKAGVDCRLSRAILFLKFVDDLETEYIARIFQTKINKAQPRYGVQSRGTQIVQATLKKWGPNIRKLYVPNMEYSGPKYITNKLREKEAEMNNIINLILGESS